MKRRHLSRTTWHVMMRGARKQILFRDDADRKTFLSILQETLLDKGATLHSWVILDNHYQLLVSADWEALGRFMQQLNRRYSRTTNAKYELKGHLFEGTYISFPQRTSFWIGRTAMYIDTAPVRAGVVKSAEAWRWSSCRAYLKGSGSPIPIDRDPVLDALGGMEGYKRFEPAPVRKKPKAPLTAMDVWADQVAWLLDYAHQRRDLLEKEAPQTIAASWSRKAGIPPRAIAEALGYSNGHSVSVLLDSVRKRAESNSKLRKILATTEI